DSFVFESSKADTEAEDMAVFLTSSALRATPRKPTGRPRRSRMRVMVKCDTHSSPSGRRLTTCPVHVPRRLRLFHMSSYTRSGVLPEAMNPGDFPSHCFNV